MSNVTGTIRAKLVEVRNPTIFNVACALANTEYSQALPANTKKFLLRCRGDAKIKFSYITGETNINYISVPSGVTYIEESLDFSSSIYFEVNKNTQIIEILAWT